MRNASEAKLLAQSEFKKLAKMDRDLSLNMPLNVGFVVGCIFKRAE